MSKLPPLKVKIGQAGTETRLHGSWYRGPKATFMPDKATLTEPEAIETYLLQGWLPDAPFIDKQTPILAFGSCFAGYITHYLRNREYNVLGAEVDLEAHIVRYGEGMANSFVILQQLEWALGYRDLPEAFLFDEHNTDTTATPSQRLATLDLIKQAKVFIFTLGLTEVWHNKVINEPIWRAITKDQFNPDIHEFRVTGFIENYENLSKIITLAKSISPDVRIILTLSPVPLMATFRPISCISASSASKATLRAVIDQIMRDRKDDTNLHYLPSYEFVKEVAIDPYMDDNRHPRLEIINQLLELFETHYCADASP